MNRLLLFLNKNHFPGFDRYIDWLRTPLGWMAMGALASFLVAITHSKNGWWMLAFFSAVIVLQLFWPWVQLKGCRAKLSMAPKIIEEGGESKVVLEVQNLFPFSLLGIQLQCPDLAPQDEVPSDSNEKNNAISLSSIPGSSKTTFTWTVGPSERGRYPRTPISLSCSFPFGIWTCTKELDNADSLLVKPRTIRLQKMDDHRQQIGQGLEFQNRAGDVGELLGVRKWQEGQPFRMIHWSQSAKSEEDFFVLEKQTPQPNVVRVLMEPAAIEAGQFNEMIRIYATLVLYFLANETNVEVLHETHVKRMGCSLQLFESWLEELAVLDFSNVKGEDQETSVSRSAFADSSSTTPTWRIQAGEVNGRTAKRVIVSFESGSSQSSSTFSIPLDPAKNSLNQFAHLWKENRRETIAQ